MTSTNLPELPPPPGNSSPHGVRAVQMKTWVIAFISLALLVLAAYWIYLRLTHLHIDDARVDGEVITISSRVAGWVTELPVAEGDAVKQGQLLARIDDRDARLQREVLQAKLAALHGQVATVKAQSGQVNEETLGKYQSESNLLSAAEVELIATEARVRQAAEEFRRTQELANQKWLSQQALERARLIFQQSELAHRKAAANVAAARGTLSSAGGSRKQVQVLEQQQHVLARQADELAAELRRQEIDIADRQLISPADGKVVMTFVRKGEHVSTGQRLLMFHDPAKIWISANVRETDIDKLRMGMRAEIHVDAYPDRVFEGRIARIGQATTSKFALLPDPNPSGNFTKITQRLPVRIQLERNDELLRPGMMVEVIIDVRNH